MLEIKDLNIEFITRRGNVQAVSDLSMQVDLGERLGLVGESGSGKSVTALSILQLLASPPAKVHAKKNVVYGKRSA